MELISREEVRRIVNDICNHALKTYVKTYHLPIRTITISITEQIGRLPTIESRPKGKWIAEYTDIRGYTTSFQCSNCYRVVDFPSLIKVERMDYDYCPYCGSDMRGEE